MLEFIKTIVNALKVYIDEKFVSTRPDWNQNDESAENYIENRTHWEETKEIKVDFLPKCTVEVSESNDGDFVHYGFDGNYNQELIIGKKYTVAFDGEVFKDLICYDDEGYPTLGAPWMDYSNYHFTLYSWKEDEQIKLSFYTDSAGSSHTLSVTYTEVKEIVHKIDLKYLPDDIGVQSDWNQNDENAKDYVKNRPFYETTEEIISLEIVDPISDLTGSSYTQYQVGKYQWSLYDKIKLRIDGVLYEFDGFVKDGISTNVGGSYVWRVGAPYGKGNITDSSEYPFTIILFESFLSEYANIQFEDGTNNHTVEVIEEGKIHHLDSKYIKDMYYEEKISLDITLSGNDNADYTFTDTSEDYSILNRFRKIIEDASSANEKVYVEINSSLYSMYPKVYSGYYVLGFTDEGNSGDIVIYNYMGGSGAASIRFSPYNAGNYGENITIGSDSVNIKIYEKYEIHQIDPKYIKDMYYETEPIETIVVPETTVEFDYENGEEFIEGAIDITLVEGESYFVNWNGTTYECVCYDYDGLVIGNNECWGGNNGNGEPFLISNYDNLTAINVYEGGTYTVSISILKSELHYVPTKYIKDMYYEKQNITSIKGLEYIVISEVVGNGNNYPHDYIPLESGQIYDVYRNNSVLYGTCEVKTDENGDCYIGTSDYSEHPFYITPTVTYVRSSWIDTVGVLNLKIVGVSGNITESEIHQIDMKYLPIMEEAFETVFEIDEIESNMLIEDPSYKMILGQYKVTVDGKSENVEFIDDGGGSFAEGTNWAIDTWDGGIWFECYGENENPHSLKIEKIKNVIKEEHLPDIGSAVFTVNITENEDGSYSADKTFAEIVEAYESGKNPIAKWYYDGTDMLLYFNGLFDDECIVFSYHRIVDVGQQECVNLYVYSDNSANVEWTNFDMVCDEYSLTTTNKTIVGAINELNAKHTEGTDTLILLSPNGTKFNITVGDDGVLTATEITE